jgi:hypothetical protein
MRRYLTKYNKNVWLFEDLFKKLDLRLERKSFLWSKAEQKDWEWKAVPILIGIVAQKIIFKILFLILLDFAKFVRNQN